MPTSSGGRGRAPAENGQDKVAAAPSADLVAGQGSSPHKPLVDLEGLSEERLDHLHRRLKAAKALSVASHRSRKDVEAAARKWGVDPATMYRDLKRLQGQGTIRDLIPHASGYPNGRSRLHVRQDELIHKFLLSDYLSRAEPSLLEVTRKIGDACEAAGFSRPGKSAVARRASALPKRLVVLKRKGAKAAEQVTPRPGAFEVQEPWDVWQIDHTLADVIVVDQEGRPIGRAWITVVIDVCTRMIVAFYVGLDPPRRSESRQPWT